MPVAIFTARFYRFESRGGYKEKRGFSPETGKRAADSCWQQLGGRFLRRAQSSRFIDTAAQADMPAAVSYAMPSATFDFGLFIAYVVPGFLTLVGVALVYSPLARLFAHISTNSNAVVAVFALSCFSVVAGLVVSICRASTVDQTFALNYPSKPHAIFNRHAHPEFDGLRRQDPNYLQLADEGRREAFLLAVSNDKRPYQFYGKCLLALIIIAICYVLRERTNALRLNRHNWLIISVWLLMVISLYGGARLSHFRFMRAVIAINAQPPQSATP